MNERFAQLELLSRQVHQAHRNAVSAEMNARGLGEVGHPMLLTILKAGTDQPFAQRELAEMLHISSAAVAGSLKSLEKGGYIRREPEPGDARRNRVQLTAKGWMAVADGAAAVHRAEGFLAGAR